MTNNTTIYRMFRQYMADYDLFLVPANWLQEHPANGIMLLCEPDQFQAITSPSFCVDGTLGLEEMLNRMEEHFLILKYYAFDSLGKDIFNLCEVVDECFLIFDDVYFVPFTLVKQEEKPNDDYRIQPKGDQ